MSSIDPPRLSPKAGKSARTRAVLAQEVQEKLGEALTHLQKLSSDEHESREAIDEVQQSISRMVDAKLSTVRQDVSMRLEAVADEIRDDVAKLLGSGSTEVGATGSRTRRFSEKVFVVRNSVLTNMLAKPDFQSIENIFIAMLVWLGVNIVMQEWFDHHRLVDTTIFFFAFGKLEKLMPLWLCMCGWSLLVVPFVQAIKQKRWTARQWMWIFVPYQLILLIIPSILTVYFALPPASGFIAMCEMARFCMKVHAYVREKMLYGLRVQTGTQAAPRRLGSGKPKAAATEDAPAASGSADSTALPPLVYQKYADFIPAYAVASGMTIADLNQPHIDIQDSQTELGRFIYFLFAPTLVYRDSYPRSGNEIRWVAAFGQFANLLGVLAYTFLIFRTFCIPTFADTSRNPGDIKTFILSVMRSMVPSMGAFVLMFYGVLHSWFNMWAELLRFGDRQFYEDWWNARSFGSYYRRWNAVVHEWLYYYLYLDVIRFSLGRFNKLIAMALVFLVSAIVHEQIIACAMGFFFPVLLFMFGGPGVYFVNLTKSDTRFYNVFLWLMLSVGNALLMVLYSREWFSRYGEHPVQYPGMDEGWMMFVPRSLLAFYQRFL